ncbi:MAG: beta strand repeat-containing protein, partial [Gammaproteobacteria bacterium]
AADQIGLLVNTGSSVLARGIQTDATLTVSNGDGVAGNPQLALASVFAPGSVPIGQVTNSIPVPVLDIYGRVVGFDYQSVPSSALANSVWLLAGNTSITSGGALGENAIGSYLGLQSGSTADLRLVTNGKVRAIIGATDGTLTTGDINAQTITADGLVVQQDILIGGAVSVGLGGGANPNNFAAGQYALSANVSGSNNLAVGSNALTRNKAGNENTGIGYGALQNLGNTLTPSNNTAIGSLAGGANTLGSKNTFIGAWAGQSNLTGSRNVYIGAGAGASASSGLNDRLFIATTDFSNNPQTLIYGDFAAGRVGIYSGAVNPTINNAALQVNTKFAGDRGLVINGVSGQSANLFEAMVNDGTAVATISPAGLATFGTATTGGLTINGTSNVPNVTIASLGGLVNATLPSGFNRMVVADTTGSLSQVTLTSAVSSQAWALVGNAGTTVDNFLGTTDTAPLVIRTNSVERFRVSGTDGTTTFTAPLVANNGLTANTLTVTGATALQGTATVTGLLTADGGVTTNTLTATTSVTTPLLTNAGTLALSATGTNPAITFSTGGAERARFNDSGLVLSTLATGASTDDFLSVNTLGVVRRRNLGEITGSFWALAGNAAIPDNAFLGTQGAQDLVVKTANAERFRVSGTNGTTTFTAPLVANGGLTADTLTVSGAATLNSLGVTNAATVGGLLTANGGLNTTNIAAAGNVTAVGAVSGASGSFGTLAVTSNATVG